MLGVPGDTGRYRVFYGFAQCRITNEVEKLMDAKKQALVTMPRGEKCGQLITMTKQRLIIASIIADLLDVFVIAQFPLLSWFIDIPIIIMHVSYAGPKGFMTLIELVPVVGTLPLFTFAAFSHEEKE